MFIPQIINSSVVWINGERVFGAGTVGKTAAETVQGTRNAFARIRPVNGRAEIVIQAANYNFVGSGLTNPITIGRTGVLTRDVLTRRVALGFALGIFVMMGLYHLILFTQRRGEWVYLSFSLMCLVSSVRFFFGANALGDLLLPGGLGAEIPLVLSATFILQMATLIVFAHIVFDIPLKSRPRRIIYAASLIGSCLLILPGAPGATIYLVMIPLIWLAIDATRAKRLRDNRYNMLFLAALFIYVLWTPFVILVMGNQVFSPGIIPTLFLTLSQCVMLGVSYAETKRREEELAAQTDFYRKMSHNMRTPLTKISTNIQIANRCAETDHERLEKSQDEIMRIAYMIDAALEDSESGVDR